jgi:hypothetical protein
MSAKKSKTDLLLEAIQPKEYVNFERYLVSKLGKSHNIDYLSYWVWKKEEMRVMKKGNGESVKPFKQKLTRKFFSDFNKHIEGYFVGVSVERDEQLRKIFMLTELRMRKADIAFNDFLKEVKGFNNNRVLKGFANNVLSLRAYFEEYMILNARNDEQGMANISADICKITEIVYFQNELFHYINLKLFVSKPFKPLPDIEIIMKRIVENSSFFEKNHTNVYVLYRIAKVIRGFDTTADLLEVVRYLNRREKSFTVGFLKIAYESLFRLALFGANTGNSDAHKVAFRVFKEMERKGILKKLPHIQPLIFFSAISLSLRLGDIDFAEKLISNYSNKLISVPHDKVLLVCRGMIDYEKGKLDEAKEKLLNLKNKNATLYLYSKVTLIKIMYDKNELRGIMSFADSVKHYLLRKEEINEVYRESIFRFLSYVTNLAVAKRKNGRGLFQVRERYNSETGLFQRNWVLKKIKELEEIYKR